MKVLSIDPGYDRLGLAVLERQAGQDILLFSTCFTTDKKDDLVDRLYQVGQMVSSLLQEHKPDLVALETLFFNNNQKTAMGVAQVRGIIIYLAMEAGCKVAEYGPQAIKVATTGYGHSDKAAVISMIKRLITNAPIEALDDEYDAIAVGVTALAHHR